MTLSPLSISFVSRSSYCSLSSRSTFISSLSERLSLFDFHLFMSILNDWEISPLLISCLAVWEKYESIPTRVTKGVNVLSFNVRGFDLRWQEVLLLAGTYDSDVLILLETGDVDLSLSQQSFHNYSCFFQRGENKNGGDLVMVRANLYARRVKCDVPNVCIIELPGTEDLRVIGIYAPASRTWTWDQLSPFISNSSVLYGDFNIDLEKDKDKAATLLSWADELLLAPFTPSSGTSRRSDRTIDYAFSNGPEVSLAAHLGGTTSDHLPIVSRINTLVANNLVGFSTHWKVFNAFTEYTQPFWQKQWCFEDLDATYSLYTLFLSRLKARCTTSFPMKKYRVAIPPDLRSYLSYIRALSFRQLRTQCPILKISVKEMRKHAKFQLQNFLRGQFACTFNQRYCQKMSMSFWSRVKHQISPSQSRIYGLLATDGSVVKDNKAMCDLAARFYEDIFKKSDNIMHPHPYTDVPYDERDQEKVSLPPVSLKELLESLVCKKIKRSVDAHGISPLILRSLHISHWDFLLQLFNRSFSDFFIPSGWKDTRILLLAKKAHICDPAETRPISLLDTFQKLGEKLFLSRFRKVLDGLGLLPDNQSGFRQGFRLQTRVLLFIDDLLSNFSNSSPIASIFVDFKRAFDMLWHVGCVGKLLRMGIPSAYTQWILRWLEDRRGFIEIGGCRSNWLNIEKGGPQGGVLTPTLFVSYHADMPQFLACSSSHFFADDLAAIIAGNIGSKYRSQCLDLEKRVKSFLDQLESYCSLAGQLINFSKTEALWSARAVGAPTFEIKHNEVSIGWSRGFKYLGYWISPKLGWSKMIHMTKIKIRQRIARISSFKLFGISSSELRKALFNSYVLPLFTWLFPIFPLFTDRQRADLEHFYFTCVKRIRGCLRWNDELVSFAFEEIPLHDRCVKYWEKFLVHLADSEDGTLLMERANWNSWREMWLSREFSITGTRISKRFKNNSSVLERALDWLSSKPSSGSIPSFEWEDIDALRYFPESFL